MENFCPLINGACNRNCVFIEKIPGNFGVADNCSLASAVKASENRPDVDLLTELKKLANGVTK